MKTKNVLLLFYFLLLIPIKSMAQSVANQNTTPDPVTKTEQQQVIDSVSLLLNKNYVFPEVAKKMSDLIASNLKNGSYASITDPTMFSEKLTADLLSISNDKHIRVVFNPAFIKEIRETNKNSDHEEIPSSVLDQWKSSNYGFKEIKILDGNIGYLDLRNFMDPSVGGETAVAAMNFFANANALIIDLRKNGGGSPQMIQLITSYFYDSEPVHLNNFYFRPDDSNTQTWTLPYVNGKRMPKIDLYVLTSRGTFSAAEEFTYNLKNLHRATIIGEVTGGGANPGGDNIATDRFTVWIPTGRAINPITKTNWEGTGVQPDIVVPADDALYTAQIKALEKLAANETKDPIKKYSWLLTSLKAKQHPLVLEKKEYESYIGIFGPRIITYENGNLYCQVNSVRKLKMLPLKKDIFDLEDRMLRVEFKKVNNKISGITIVNVNGTTENFDKNKS
ncbi:S41 family peptidase [Flavobacterium sp. ov086]|uniref:S41 family peptidase n=1 Tax=Flavobacterium sp. ov086 TaxID=1761785 RepID=UPI000B6304CF|nr:S41 family peptidase [Flavobacterium sp. ov086]SNR81801.1 N-terminal domain of Peptidase_S41 [Flavobacterium sp. ov086]